MGFGAVAFAMSDSFLVSFLARALVGFGGSVIFLAILRFAVTWFRADEYATVTGLTIGVSALGGIIATTPLAIAASVIGWRSSMLVIGSLCVVSALFIFLSVRDRPVDETDSESPELTADGGPTSLRDDLRSVLGGSDVWALGILNFLILGVNFTIIGLWGVPYLVHLYDLSVARVAVRPRWQRRPAYWLTAVWVDCGPYRRSHRAGVDLNARVLCRLRHPFSSRDTALAFVGILFFTAMFVNGGVSLAFTVGRQRHPTR